MPQKGYIISIFQGHALANIIQNISDSIPAKPESMLSYTVSQKHVY